MGALVGKAVTAAPQDTKAEMASVEKEWQALKTRFTRTMPAAHKVIYIIHEGRQFLHVEEATDVVSEILSVSWWTPIDVVLHTLGGNTMACEMIAEALVKRPFTRAYVPFYALSAGTQIALATRKIILGQNAALGPTDIQFGGISPKELEQLEQEVGFENLPVDVQLMIIHTRGAIKRDIKTVCKLINRQHMTLGDRLFGRCTLAEKLSGGGMPHDHRITHKEARRLGINVAKRKLKRMYKFISARRQQLKKMQDLDQAIRIINAKGSKNPSQRAKQPAAA